MFRKKFIEQRTLEKELKAREVLGNKFVLPVINFDFSKRIIEFKNNHVNLEEFVKIYDKYCLPESVLYTVVFKLCKAIQHMNEKGIIHLDLKPTNILVNKRFNVYINDFENFVNINESTEDHPKAEGNFLYRAPERDGDIYGTESNTFSLGLLVYYVVHGKHPYSGLSSDEIIKWKEEWKIEYSPVLHPLLSYLIDNCINPDPQKRFIFDIKEILDCIYFKDGLRKISEDQDRWHSLFLMFGQLHSVEHASDPRQEFAQIVGSLIRCPYLELFIDMIGVVSNCHDAYSGRKTIIFDKFCEETYFDLINPNASGGVVFGKSELLYLAVKRYIEYPYMIPPEAVDGSDLDLTGAIPQHRAYQTILGKGVALDVVEGALLCLGNFSNYSVFGQYHYIVVQPLIMANFPDAAELLCLDLNHIIGISLLEVPFDFIATDKRWLFSFFKSRNIEPAEDEDATYPFSIGTLMYRNIEKFTKAYSRHFSFSDYNVKFGDLIDMAQDLNRYFSMYITFFNLISRKGIYEKM